jgi:hypothetical protein
MEKCVNCGASLTGPTCDYCGSHHKETKNSIKVIISGKMNDVTFSYGDGEDTDISVSGNMGNYKYKTNKKLELYISGNMNDVKIKGVPYSLKEDSGKMNSVKEK